MEGNRDWKMPAALILAGLALFVALSGRNSMPFTGSEQGQPGQTIVIQNAQPSGAPGSSNPGGTGQVVPAPNIPATVPSAPNEFGPHFGSGYGFGHGVWLFKFFLLGLLLLFVFRFFGRHRWQRYAGGYGPGPWRGYGQPPQPPQQGQPTQGPQPGQGPGHWEWHADSGAPPAESNQGGNNGDIMRPGEGDQG